jgi:RNA polymerase sigma-70 factor (ECF subfamily)
MSDDASVRIAGARAAWPQIAVDEERFRAYVGERSEAGEPLLELSLDDLYLACGCALGDAEAIRLFEAHFIVEIDTVLRHMRLEPALLDEIKQLVRDKVLIGAPPKIADYSGRGALRGWLRAVATRTALDALRKQARSPSSEEELYRTIPAATDDPETAALRRRYAAEFADAFRRSFAALTARERLLLKRHFVDGLSTEQLGALHSVHRVTVLRWISQALEQLASRAEELLLERLRLPRSEYQSLVRLVRSQLDLSLGSLLLD